ncbi:unnamed protein product [Caenorhabditis nigoni]
MHFERWRKLKPGHVALLKRNFRDAIVINVRRSGVPQIKGNGAFLGQAIRKHQCLEEYVGEVIPKEEGQQ